MNVKKRKIIVIFSVILSVLIIACIVTVIINHLPTVLSPEEWKEQIEEIQALNREARAKSEEADELAWNYEKEPIEKEIDALTEKTQKIINKQLPSEKSYLDEEFLNEFLEHYTLEDFIDCVNTISNQRAKEEDKDALEAEVCALIDLLKTNKNVTVFRLSAFTSEPQGYYKENSEKIPHIYNGEDVMDEIDNNSDDSKKITALQRYSKLTFYDDFMIEQIEEIGEMKVWHSPEYVTRRVYDDRQVAWVDRSFPVGSGYWKTQTIDSTGTNIYYKGKKSEHFDISDPESFGAAKYEFFIVNNTSYYYDSSDQDNIYEAANFN